MANTYKYKAVDSLGMTVTGTVEAADRTEAIVFLKSKFPVVKSITNLGEKGKGMSMELGDTRIKEDSISLLCSQYSIILNSGAQVVESTNLIANQTEDKKLQKILRGVSTDVMAGKSLAAAFERNGGKDLPVTFYETVRAGEDSGNLAKAFTTLKDYYQKSSKTAKSVKSAMTYPIFVVFIAIAVLVVVMVKVIPSMTGTFASMGGEIPGVTKALIAASDFFIKNLWLIIGGVAAVVVGYLIIYNTKEGRLAIDAHKLRSKIMGKMTVANLASQFSTILGMLVASGLTMTKALRILAKTFDNMAYQQAILNVANDVENGKSLGASMRRQGVFPGTLTEMVATGEETGNLENVLATTGEYYTNEAEMATKAFLGKLEPTMLMFVAGFGGFIVIAIYLPMFQMYDMF